MEHEKDEMEEQLRQVKDILRNMIIEKAKGPTETDLERERDSCQAGAGVREEDFEAGGRARDTEAEEQLIPFERGI